EYEALALKLATDPSLLQSIRRKLEQNRLSHPLFDTNRFCRHIEAAYHTMWQIWQRGESPRSFGVTPGPDTVGEIDQQRVSLRIGRHCTDQKDPCLSEARKYTAADHKQEASPEAQAVYQRILDVKRNHLDTTHPIEIVRNQQDR